jgi:hypothetical protein
MNWPPAISFGKHKGKSLQTLLLKFPGYMRFLLSLQALYKAMTEVQHNAWFLIRLFDAKPFLETCWAPSCGKRAVRCTVYKNNPAVVLWWCADCDPHQSGAKYGTLTTISTYRDALAFVASRCHDRAAAHKRLVSALAKAKGLAARVGEAEAKAFFRPAPDVVTA